MDKKKIVIFGSGGHCKSVVDAIESTQEYEIVGFLDNKENTYKSYKVIGTDSFAKELYNSGVKYAFLGIGFMGNGNVREKISDYACNIGFEFPIIIDPSAVVAKDVKIGEGTFIGKNAVVNSNALIGKQVIINSGAIVEHDCSVAEFSHIAVGAVLCGNVTVGKQCLIGTNATVLQGRKTGNNSIVGAGTIVAKDILDDVTMRMKLELVCTDKNNISMNNVWGGGTDVAYFKFSALPFKRGVHKYA